MQCYIYYLSGFLHVFFSRWGVLEGLSPYLRSGVVRFVTSGFGFQTLALLLTHNSIFYPHHELLVRSLFLCPCVGTTISLILIHPPIGYELLAARP